MFQKMIPFKNLNNKRIFDISEDCKLIKLIINGAVTIITANPDGTLNPINLEI